MVRVAISWSNNGECIFHYWLPILRDLLPCSLLEEWQNASQSLSIPDATVLTSI